MAESESSEIKTENFAGLEVRSVDIINKNGNVINLIDDENATSVFQSMTINQDMFSAGVHGTLLFKDSGIEKHNG